MMIKDVPWLSCLICSLAWTFYIIACSLCVIVSGSSGWTSKVHCRHSEKEKGGAIKLRYSAQIVVTFLLQRKPPFCLLLLVVVEEGQRIGTIWQENSHHCVIAKAFSPINYNIKFSWLYTFTTLNGNPQLLVA